MGGLRRERYCMGGMSKKKNVVHEECFEGGMF